MLVKRFISFAKFIYPYILILLASLLSNYLLFRPGIAAGDDIRFHLFQINDLVYGFQHGHFGLSTNYLYYGGFALNNYGFYGPVPHYSAAISSFLFAGGQVEFGYKFVIFLSTFIGGIYFYKMAMRMTKNTVISIIASTLFIVMPYRTFCALCRCAFAETVAISFIPMIFYGAYSIVHDDTYHVGPYISLIIGASVVIMSHPFTGLMCAIFGVLYLACNVRLLFRKNKGFHIWPSLLVSGVLILFFVGFYVGNALVTKSAGIYRLNDPVIDWTNYEHVASSTSLSLHFSGFLNLVWINQMQGSASWDGETISQILMSLFVFVLGFINMVVADMTIRFAPENKKYRWFVTAVAMFMFPFIFQVKPEIYVMSGIAWLLFMSISYFYDPLKTEEETDKTKLKYNPDVYFLIVSIFICLLLMFVPGIWLVLPSLFYQCQFAWRIWGLCMFFVAMLLTLLMSYLKKYKAAVISFASIAALMVGLSQSLIEKRVHYDVNGRIFSDIDIAYVMTNSEARYSGAQNEMVPLVIMDSAYSPTYGNSLYFQIRTAVQTRNHFIYSLEDYRYYTPAFLEGEGYAIITEYDSPNNTFNVCVDTDRALVQFPQFYNIVYEAYADGKYIGEAQNIDGLIAFELPKGNYSLSIIFKNSKPYQIARPFFYAAIPLTVSFGLFGVYYRHKTLTKKKEES